MKSKLILFTYIFSVLLLESICIEHSSEYDFWDEEIIHLIDNDTALPTPNDENSFYIPIIHTNDIHGSFYIKTILLPSGEIYSIGGLEYLGKYVTICQMNGKIDYYILIQEINSKGVLKVIYLKVE